MLAPMPTPCIPSGFPLLGMASGQIAHPGGPTMPRTKVDGQTASSGGQASLCTRGRGGLTARTRAAPSSPASLTSATLRVVPMSLAPPHATLLTPPVPRTALASTTTTAPHTALEPYPLHYLCRPRVAQGPPAPPLHQQPPPVKVVPVEPPVNPHPMTTRVKRSFRLSTDRLTLSPL
jgi:hypothetical protein